MLTAETLRGVWALVNTPWDQDGRLEEDALRHNVAYQCRSGVHGLYTTGSSGEFYAMEFDEFRLLVDIFLNEVKQADMDHQIGCAWSDTRGAVQRAEYAVERGAAAIQISFPYYIKPSLEEGFRFFEDVARACGQVPLIHYNTAHSRLILGADAYRRLKDRVPTLIGTKQPPGDPLRFYTLCETAHDISHFTGEYSFAHDFAAGARGIYSWLGVTNPRLMLEWYEACRRGDWSRAVAIQSKVNRYKVKVKMKWHGLSDAAVNKADSVLNANIRCRLSVRPPYTPCTVNDLRQAREWAEDNFPELLQL